MTEDLELERLKAKRLAEMQKNMSSRSVPDEPSTDAIINPRELLINRLGYRGLEVLQNAEYQFPNESKMVIEKLAELLQSGEINEQIDGGKLLALFRSIGLNIKMQTKIHVEKDGEFVSLSDKIGIDHENQDGTS